MKRVASRDGKIAYRRRQRGVSLIIGIFIVVVISLLGASMVAILQQGSEAVAREVVATRALMAAESGAERVLNHLLVGGSSAGCSTNVDTPTAPTGLLPEPLVLAGPGLANCEATQRCAVITVNTIEYYHIRSQGTCGVGVEAAVRVVEVQARL